MLRVHQADVRQNALFPHLCILQWSTLFQLCEANHLQQSARCYWKTPAGLASRNGLSDQQVVVAVGCCCCCCCCLGSALTLASGHSVAESTGWSLVGKQIRGRVSEASDGLEKMRVKNRMRSRGKNTTHMLMRQIQSISLNQFKQGIKIDLTSVTKCLNYTIKSGKTTTDMVVY